MITFNRQSRSPLGYMIGQHKNVQHVHLNIFWLDLDTAALHLHELALVPASVWSVGLFAVELLAFSLCTKLAWVAVLGQ